MALPSPRIVITSLIDSLGHPAASDHEDSNDGAASSIAERSTTAANSADALRKTFLTLHVLFPYELLPALDLLDRCLVTRFRTRRNVTDGSSHQSEGTQGVASEDGPTASALPEPDRKATTAEVQTTYLVRSSQQQSNFPHGGSRHANSTYLQHSSDSSTTKTYLVSLMSWSCSCPAFAFAAFPPSSSASSNNIPDQAAAGDIGTTRVGTRKLLATWRAGGLTRGEDVPICNHLLACLLAEGLEGDSGVGAGGLSGEIEEREVNFEEIAGWAAGWGD